MENVDLDSLDGGTDRDSSANNLAFSDQILTKFPDPDDWQGWVDVWCGDDTGNIDCVPECLRTDYLMNYVREDGYAKHPDMAVNTPYKLARWLHDGPRPPWCGTGMTPDHARKLWEDKLTELSLKAEAEIPADLYFIQSGEGPIKIGVSECPDKRLRQLQTSHPYKLQIRCLVPGGALLEGEYHQRFAEHRLEGEWFEPHPDILAEIDRIASEEPRFTVHHGKPTRDQNDD